MQVECPMNQCRVRNDADAETCAGCGSPLLSHTRLSAHAAHLFNQGLAAARAGEFGRARELLAAVVHWCPLDCTARNALALANFELHDVTQARYHWNQVLAQRANDPFAAYGLRRLDDESPAENVDA